MTMLTRDAAPNIDTTIHAEPATVRATRDAGPVDGGRNTPAFEHVPQVPRPDKFSGKYGGATQLR